jgi:hypothetical protein
VGRSAKAMTAGLLVVVLAACGSSSPTPATSAAAASSPPPAATTGTTAPPAPSAAPSSASAAPVASSAAPSAAATASPAPSPSASAGTNVAAEFTKQIAESIFRPHIDLKAVATVAGQTIATTGTIDVGWIATRTVTTTVAAGKRTTTDKITTDTKTYERKFGQYFLGKNDPSDADLAKVIKATGGFTDAGMDTRDGVSLHHLTVTDASKITGADIGLAADIAASAKVGVEGWADDTGTPKAMRITATWDQPLAGGSTTPAQMVMDLAFNGTAATISEPSGEALWVIRTSKVFKYQVGVPASWAYSKGNKKYYDLYDAFGGYQLQVGGFPSLGWTTNSWTAYVKKHPSAWWSSVKKAKVTPSKSGRLGGSPARTFTVSGTNKGTVWYYQVAITTHKGKLYTLFLGTSHKPNAIDKAMFASALATFAFK